MSDSVDCELDVSWHVFESFSRILVREVGKADVVDTQDLVSLTQSPVLACSSVRVDMVDEDGQISMLAALASHNAEAQLVRTSLKLDHQYAKIQKDLL